MVDVTVHNNSVGAHFRRGCNSVGVPTKGSTDVYAVRGSGFVHSLRHEGL